MTHPGPANGASAWISERLGGDLPTAADAARRERIFSCSEDEEIEGEIHFGSLLIQRSRHFVDS